MEPVRTLEIHIPEDVATRVEQAAHEKGVSVDDLVRLSIEEKLAREAEFEAAAKHVLAKNADLYQRLS
jgi:glutamyl-tRNA reductase